MGADEEGTVARIRTLRAELIDPVMAANRGRMVNAAGDGLLLEFASVVDAVRCAMEMQEKIASRNVDYRPEERIEFRIGIHLGDVIVEEDGNLMGEGVNIAARLEAIAEPGGICLSEDAYRQVRDRLKDEYIDLGEQQFKNIARPVRAYRLAQSEGKASPSAPSAKLALPEKPAIAVLPFVNMSDDPDQEHFSDGISEDIITALSKLRWFFVIARNSSFTYKGKAVHVKQIGQELGVDYLLEGSVRKFGDRVRITAQLNDTATGAHLWAERYDRDLADVFAVQDEITEAIVASIEPQLYAAENFHAQRKPPDSMDAWDLVVRALSHYWRVTPEDNIAAQALLEKAIAIDPCYGKALGLFAVSHLFGAHMGWEDRATAVPVAEPAALKAIRADSEDPWAHLAVATLHVWWGRYDDSLAQFELALRLHPNFSLARGYYGMALCYCGRWEEGAVAARRALRLSPRDPFSAVYYGIAAFCELVACNYDEAIRMARESIRLRSDFAGGHRVLVAATAMTGEIELARAALQELRRAQPGISLAWVAALPYHNDAVREHCLEGFRRAGLD
jgi:TolB-like protein/Tfp pilus assembly protein PilF